MMDISKISSVIEVLEVLEQLMEKAPTHEVEGILQLAWLQISETFPDDFLAATHNDASAEGLRRYLKVKAFFEDPTNHPLNHQELEKYYQHLQPIDEDNAEFFFLDSTDTQN